MELQQIRYFLALSEDLNFTRAAERCGVSQPSLTRAIKRLEAHLGAPLVRRERQHTHLTELGVKVKPRLEQALRLTEKVKSDASQFSQMSNPKLSIGVMTTVGPTRMMPIVRHLESKFPQLALSLKTSSGCELSDSLLSGEIDVAILSMPRYPDEIAAHELYKERYMVAFPSNHRFQQMEEIPLQELEGEKNLKRLNCEFMNFLQAELSEQDWKKLNDFGPSLNFTEAQHESEHEELIQAMIIAGIGCAVVPEYLSPNAELHMRPLAEPNISRTISVATVRGRPHTPEVSYFSLLCHEMKDELSF